MGAMFDFCQKRNLDYFKALFGKIQAYPKNLLGEKRKIWLGIEVIDVNDYFEEKDKSY